jgi:hypothetical protein
MLATSDPNVKQAVRTFHGRVINAALGCITGLLFPALGGASAWKRPVALSATVLLRVGEAMLGCVVGLVVAWAMSKVWPAEIGAGHPAAGA